MREITYEMIKQANDAMITLPITRYSKKDKAYVTKNYAAVAQRVVAFRKVYPCGRIETSLVKDENGLCQFMACVSDENGNVLGVGHAYEIHTKEGINASSYLENCETSAVGRALGFAGFGNQDDIASAEEIIGDINKQNFDELTSQPKPLSEEQKKNLNGLIETAAASLKSTNKNVIANVKRVIGVPFEEMNAEHYARACALIDSWISSAREKQ